MSTEMVQHFFASLGQALGAALHLQVTGENTHHMIEALFKGAGRALKPALERQGNKLPSTKGVL
jgi:imidazoleglycerol-phosphate dehydratase/histidinol-phosphatase